MKNIIKKIRGVFNPPKVETILVIDDSEVDRTFAVRVLSRHYRVLAAAGAKEGLEIASRNRPDLVLLDYMMPEMKGPEVCRILKQTYGMNEIPVIFLTSIDTPRNVLDGLEEGAEAFLIKPIGSRDLLEQVRLRLHTMVFTEKDA